MKKIFKMSVLLSILLMLCGLAACSNAAASDGGSGSKKKVVLAIYEGSKNYGTDSVIVYEDGTWEEVFSNGIMYSKGTYKIEDGDENNGHTTLTVAWTHPQISLQKGVYPIEITNGSFYFDNAYYSKI